MYKLQKQAQYEAETRSQFKNYHTGVLIFENRIFNILPPIEKKTTNDEQRQLDCYSRRSNRCP